MSNSHRICHRCVKRTTVRDTICVAEGVPVQAFCIGQGKRALHPGALCVRKEAGHCPPPDRLAGRNAVRAAVPARLDTILSTLRNRQGEPPCGTIAIHRPALTLKPPQDGGSNPRQCPPYSAVCPNTER